MTREFAHPLNVAHPIYETPGIASGSYTFPDAYLRPQVNYLNFPPTTEMTIGGRIIEIPNQVSVKCRLLDPEEDRILWNKKIQHKHRVNLGDHHRDFGDVEVSYSHTSPRTHIWFAGYAIHIETAEDLSILSYNATLRITPDAILPPESAPGPSFAVGTGMELQRVRKRVRKKEKQHQRRSKSYAGYRPLEAPIPPAHPSLPPGPTELRASTHAVGVMGIGHAPRDEGPGYFMNPPAGISTEYPTGYESRSTGYAKGYMTQGGGIRSPATSPLAPAVNPHRPQPTTALPSFPMNSGFAGPAHVSHVEYSQTSHQMSARPVSYM